MREDRDAICVCSHLKGSHQFHIGYCHPCACNHERKCKEFKWDNLDYLQAKYELNQDKKK